MIYGFLLLFVALQVADAWTTHYLLSHGGREINPRMARMIERFGLIRGQVIAKVGVVGVMFLFCGLCELIQWFFHGTETAALAAYAEVIVLAIANLIYVLVVGHNLWEIDGA